MTPSRSAFWNRYVPPTVRDAANGCKDFAKERYNYGIERLAERTALEDHWVLYKWIANGRMPLVCVPAFEAACGINLITRWLAASTGKVLIDIPTGRQATQADMVQLNSQFATALQLLTTFYANPTAEGTAETLAALTTHLQQMAYHRANVAAYTNPELDFGS